MKEIPIDIFKCTFNYRSETETWTWELVTNAKEAKIIDSDYKLASLKDLHDYVAASGYIFEGIVRVLEGEFKWVELTTEAGEDFCEYVSTSI
ncbi:hypothetical protein P4V47_16380 [Brevibacillus laterosporus]|uniref:hypothetical protein n=1 Tax=Brevibacillus laterosporus TaxID=1465 RepID=UPI002E1E3180|nr:hypothetical protein [Brevibacillus laterosporus]